MAKRSLTIEGLLKTGGEGWTLIESAPIDDDADDEEVQSGIDQIMELIKHVYSSDGNGYLSLHTCVIDIKSFASFRVRAVEW